MVTKSPAPSYVDDLAYSVPPGWTLAPSLSEGRLTARVYVPDEPAASGFVTTLLIDAAEVPAEVSVEAILDGGDAHLRRADTEVRAVWQRSATIGDHPAAARLSVLVTAAWATPVLQLRAMIDRGTTRSGRRVITIVLTCDADDGDRWVPAAVALVVHVPDDAVSENEGSRAARR
jgi:hypothetical protein